MQVSLGPQLMSLGPPAASPAVRQGPVSDFSASLVASQAPSASPELEVLDTAGAMGGWNGEADQQTQALQSFLEKMEGQLGVPPEAVLMAFRQMSPEALKAPPEEAVEEFTKALQLPLGDRALARELYLQMVRERAAADSDHSPIVKGHAAPTAPTAAPETAAPFEAPQRFGAEEPFVPANRPERAPGSAALTTSLAAGQVAGQQVAQKVGQKVGQELSRDEKVQSLRSSIDAMNDRFFMRDQISVDRGGPPVPAEEVMAHDVGKTLATGESAGWLAMSPEVLPETAQDFNSQPQFQTVDDISVRSGALDPAESEDIVEDATGAPLAESSPFPKSKTLTTENATGVAGDVVAADGEAEANLREVVTQAQYLARRGGGEMKIKLRPEGLGEIQLKVLTRDGQIQLEMMASSRQAKDLLESGLSDLKSQLASHSLSIDHIRVGLGTTDNLGTQAGFSGDNGERQAAQRFLQEFGQQNSDFRRNLFDLPGSVRPLRSQTRDEADNAYLIAAGRSRQNPVTQRRLDLVA